MRLLFKAVLLMAFSFMMTAQSTAQSETLPADWDGIWKGTLAIISPDGKSQEPTPVAAPAASASSKRERRRQRRATRPHGRAR